MNPNRADPEDPSFILERIPELKDAERFFCCVFSFWTGTSIDAVVWFERGNQRRKLILKSGESDVYLPAKTVLNEQVSAQALSQVFDKVLAAGFMGIPSQRTPRVISSVDIWYGMKSGPAIDVRWLLVRGGVFKNEEYNALLDTVRTLGPELWVDKHAS